DDDRYFDVFVEYAKASPEDILIRLTAVNRGPEPATLHLLPQLWFRNTWWQDDNAPRPTLSTTGAKGDVAAIDAQHPGLGARYLHCENADELLFTENETNCERLFGTQNRTPYVKDGIN